MNQWELFSPPHKSLYITSLASDCPPRSPTTITTTTTLPLLYCCLSCLGPKKKRGELLGWVFPLELSTPKCPFVPPLLVARYISPSGLTSTSQGTVRPPEERRSRGKERKKRRKKDKSIYPSTTTTFCPYNIPLIADWRVGTWECAEPRQSSLSLLLAPSQSISKKERERERKKYVCIHQRECVRAPQRASCCC